MLALYVGVTAWGGFAINGAGNFATAFILHSVLAGCFFTCSASLGLRLLPHARFAQFASAAGGLTADGTLLIVYVKWQRLGGMRHYEAPE